MDNTTNPLLINVDDCLGKALSDKLEILSRVKAREDNGEFEYINNDLSNAKNMQDLIDICVLKTPQNKGWIVEHFICNKLGWKHLPTWKHRGDGYSFQEKRAYEIKTSFTADELLLKQVRLFQKIDYYLYIYFNESNLDKSNVYLLDHEAMYREVKKLGHRNKHHGSTKGNSYDIEIPFDSYEYTLWNRQYKNEFLKRKIFE